MTNPINPHVFTVEVYPKYSVFTQATVEHISDFLSFAVQDYMQGDDAQIPYQGVVVRIEPYVMKETDA